MKRKHWGDLPKDNDEEKLARINDIDKKIIIDKRSELKILHSSVFLEQSKNETRCEIKNPEVNAIIGIKQKQELIQELIDTSNYNSLNFQQMLPTLKETLPILSSCPLRLKTPRYNCFLPSSSQSDFARGKPKQIPKINKECVEIAMKKSICGLVRVHGGFTSITTSALTLFTDVLSQFYKSLIEEIVNVMTNENRESDTEVDVLCFERAYFQLMNDSSASLLLNYATNIFNKHKETALEFNEKVDELKSIVESHQGLFNEMSSAFPANFFVKQESEIKQEIEEEY